MHTLLFDIGNVLVTFDFDLAFKGLVKGGADREKIESSEMMDLRIRHENGGIDDESFMKEASLLCGFEGDSAQFRKCWTEIFELNQPMARVVEHLAQNDKRLLLLSNTSELHLSYLRQAYPLFEKFEGGVFSHRAKSMKPDQEIYQVAIDTYDLDPRETIYLDDGLPNIEAGEKLGFRTVHYLPSKHAEASLQLRGLGVAL